ncbi:MAG TPA: TonB-dependent siderophore receptor, partial [Allosphingosinicella sp.]|nr:TonB-dependent siderophore receptor [Allosphingosinicella sp.]
LYGQTAPGGIVNLVSKRPLFDDWHGEVLGQVQGFTDLNHWRFQAGGDVTGPVAPGVAIRLVGLLSDGGNQPDRTSNSRYYLAPSVGFRLGADTTWTILGQYQRDQGGATFQFLPARGSLNQTNGRRMALENYIGEPDWNQFDRDQYLIASFFEHRFNEHFALRNNSRYTHLETLYRVVVLAGDTLLACPAAPPAAVIPGCIPGQTIQRRAVQGTGQSDGFATDTQFEARFNTGAIEHVLLAGIDYFHTDWEHYRDGVAPALVLPLLDIFNPTPRGVNGYATGLTPQIYSEVVSEQTGIYLQDQISIGNLRVAIGGRQDWASDDILNPVNNRRFVVDSDAFTWRVGAVYLFDFGLAPYASYSESFLPLQNDPSTNATGQPFLPTTGQQYEIGLRYQPPGQNIFITLSAYEITQQNLLTPAPAGTPLCGITNCQVQTGEGRFRGLELEGRASLRNGLSIIGTVTKIDAEVTESNTVVQVGNTLPQVPDWQASLFVDYRLLNGPLEGIGLGGGVRYTGDSFGDTANTLLIPSYTQFDLFMRYDVPAGRGLDGLSFALNARNLFNKQYVATCTATSACYWGAGRAVTARIQYRF